MPDGWQARWLGIDRELSYIDDAGVRQAILATAENASRGGWGRFWFRAAVTVAFFVPIAIGYAYLRMFLENRGLPSFYVQPIAIFLGMTAIGGVPFRLHRRDVQRSVRAQIRALGIPLCLHCGYNLTGIESARCPECGNAAAQELPPAANKTK